MKMEMLELVLLHLHYQQNGSGSKNGGFEGGTVGRSGFDALGGIKFGTFSNKVHFYEK